jgi:putative endonuclease
MNEETSHALGLWGEELAAAFLKKRGAQILASRWSCRFGELDLVAQIGSFLCFVEVKLRKNDQFVPARAFVTATKQKKLRMTAQRYLQQYPTKFQPRFDVIEVYAPLGRQTKHPEIIYWENAF